MIFDARPCELGEGPLWHPVREQLFWFDILNRTLHSQTRSWAFPEYVSAAGWIGADELLVACETGLFRLNLSSGERETVAISFPRLDDHWRYSQVSICLMLQLTASFSLTSLGSESYSLTW